jgi:hypothetical protein
LIFCAITFGIFSDGDIPNFIVCGEGVEGICTIGGGYLDVAIECIVSMGGGSQAVFDLLFDVAYCVVSGGKFSTFSIDGFGVPAEVIRFGLGGVSFACDGVFSGAECAISQRVILEGLSVAVSIGNEGDLV